MQTSLITKMHAVRNRSSLFLFLNPEQLVVVHVFVYVLCLNLIREIKAYTDTAPAAPSLAHTQHTHRPFFPPTTCSCPASCTIHPLSLMMMMMRW